MYYIIAIQCNISNLSGMQQSCKEALKIYASIWYTGANSKLSSFQQVCRNIIWASGFVRVKILAIIYN